MLAGDRPVGIRAPQHAADAAAEQVDQAHGVHVGDRGRAVDLDRIAPAVAALVDPQRHLAVVDIDDVGEAVAIHIAEQDALRIIAVGEARAVAHGDALAPVAMAQVRPVLDVAVVDQDDVLQAVAGHVAHLTRGSEKLTLGNSSSARRSTKRVLVPAFRGSLKKHSSRLPERIASVTPSPSRSTS